MVWTEWNHFVMLTMIFRVLVGLFLLWNLISKLPLSVPWFSLRHHHCRHWLTDMFDLHALETHHLNFTFCYQQYLGGGCMMLWYGSNSSAMYVIVIFAGLLPVYFLLFMLIHRLFFFRMNILLSFVLSFRTPAIRIIVYCYLHNVLGCHSWCTTIPFYSLCIHPFSYFFNTSVILISLLLTWSVLHFSAVYCNLFI
jgi:hypothetical protein